MVHLTERPRAGRTSALGLLLLVALTVVGVTAVPADAVATPAVVRNPVLLVHGWTAGGLIPQRMGVFQPLIAALEADGHPVYFVNLPGDGNIQNAAAIARAVTTASAKHGGVKVDLVGHSMGGLSARYYLKYLGGATHVAHYVSLGTGQYGWSPTCVLPLAAGGEMCPNSSFLRALNRGDDTPGPVRYTTLRTVADDQFLSVKRDRHLDGGVCVKDGIDGNDHAAEPSNPIMITLVRQALDGTCPGTVLNLPIAN
ncbi:alpha/beta fold hydrolase [Gordonia sp. TBRC 11910]|uniref:Alpha/beta fold hydrolase n=1 Tax=Gordonia asplenii TaxID=2725283 RepID=A0A848L7R2_9ACTN|nr:alpha/beta fold hydrolase [Gordonia asplenii]NMO05025.1 alpha/beta fold hydrolase [Gordonia asplenii]